MKQLKVLLVVLLMGSVITTAFTAGYALATGAPGAQAASPVASLLGGRGPQAARSGDTPKQFAMLGEIWSVLKRDFVEPKALDPDKLGKAAIDGVIAALDDRHTTYLDADTRKEEDTQIKGSYEGIGAHVQMNEGGSIIIVAPLAGSPAETAGIRPGDRILAVDGVSTQGMNLNAAVTKVKGPRGSKVTLTVQRDGSTDPLLIVITRDEIKTNSVTWKMLPDSIAHVRIAQFAQRTADELRQAMRDAVKQGAKGVVMDLRSNPGGLLDATVDVTNQFMEGGLAGYQVDRNGKRDSLPLTNKAEFGDIPMVVLVNQGSASGSELFSGALQDRNRAKLVGTRTFGKGSVNHLRELSDGSALYVTIGRWLTPNGRLIEGNGLTPDFPVTITEDDLRAQRDPQMDKGLDVLRAAMAAR